jgi:peptidyl-prolyl cis-trans isomerase B (cyclophilin B)
VAGDRERQRRIARERHRQQQELRRARRALARKRTLVVLSIVAGCGLVLGLVLAFLPSGKTAKPTASAKSTPTASASASASASATTSTAAVAEPAQHCTYTAVAAGTPVAKKESFPSSAPDYTDSYTATLKTNLGDLSFSLLNSKATCTVNSFVHLAEAGYFNNTQCHRLVTTGIYVLQCGDPFATATTKLTCSTNTKVGSGTPGYEFDSENLTGAKYPAGTVAMANTGTASTNGSQFFIVYKDSSAGLGATYTPFATVSSGLNIVQNVAKAGNSCQVTESGVSEGGPPKEKVIIDSVTIQKT